jgi:taurine--2-oxoglutarate transaminase
LKEIREICDEYGILLVLDETMTGWGRSGRWFACEHFDVIPDIITTAKGITSGYVPLGAVVVNTRIREHFLSKAFVGGLTNEGHPLACAAGLACIEVYEEEDLVQRSETMGSYMESKLKRLQDRHPSVGDVRAKGLFGCLEFTTERRRKRPLAGYRDSNRQISTEISRKLLDMGLFVIAKWDFLFLAPPLIVSKEQIDDAMEKLDAVLDYTDELVAA